MEGRGSSSPDVIDLPRSENVDQASLISGIVQKMIDGAGDTGGRLRLFFVESSGSSCVRISKLLTLPSGMSVGVGTDLSETYTNSHLDGQRGIDTDIVICTPHHLLRRMFNVPEGRAGGRRPFCETVVMNSGYCRKEEVDALLECFPLFGVSDIRQIKWLPKFLRVEDTFVNIGTSAVAPSVLSSVGVMDKKLHDDPRPFLVFAAPHVHDICSSLEKSQRFTVRRTVAGPPATGAPGKREVFVTAGAISVPLPSFSAVFDVGMEIINRVGTGSFPVKVSEWTTNMRKSFSGREYVSIATGGQKAAFAPKDPKVALGMRVLTAGQRSPPPLSEQESLFNVLPFGVSVTASEGLHAWVKRGLPLFPGVCAAVSEISGKPISVLLEGLTKENWRFFSWGVHETRLIGAICNSLNDAKIDVKVSDNFDVHEALDLWKECKPRVQMIFFGLPENETMIWGTSS